MLSQLQPVHGRMNRLGGDGGAAAGGDRLRAHARCAGAGAGQRCARTRTARLVCVFGCGGERDRGKRPQMAAIAERRRRPRHRHRRQPARRGRRRDRRRHPRRLRQRRQRVDRASATAPPRSRRAIGDAGAGDIVLIAGKGHEPYQEIDGVQHPFDDTRGRARARWRRAHEAAARCRSIARMAGGRLHRRRRA